MRMARPRESSTSATSVLLLQGRGLREPSRRSLARANPNSLRRAQQGAVELAPESSHHLTRGLDCDNRVDSSTGPNHDRRKVCARNRRSIAFMLDVEARFELRFVTVVTRTEFIENGATGVT